MVAGHLAEYLERCAREHPERVALISFAGGISHTLTYRELDDQAACVAAFLQSSGVERGDRVGVVLPKSAAAVAILCGVLRAGAAYVPVDWTAPGARNRAILSDCAVRALFVHPDSLARLRGSEEEQSDWKPPPVVVPVPDAAWLQVLETTSVKGEPPPARSSDDLAYILYTSGSTGVPKGVTLTHRNATSFVEWCAQVFEPSADDRFSSHAPFHFDLSVLDLFLPQTRGAALMLVPDDAAQSPKLLARLIVEQRLTVWYSTPSILSLIAQFGGLASGQGSSLRLVLFAGEVFPVNHLRTLTRLWPEPAYYNLYGPTETNVCTFAKVPVPMADDRTEPCPIGPPCAHCEALVLDEEGREVAPGEEGLLYIAGPSVFRGYWNRPDLDARVFLERGGKRWYNTGDVVHAREGEGFVYAGRRDRMVKRRGYRIELGEIENALHRCERLREAAVVAVADSETGVRIVAYVTPRDGAARMSIIELKSYCASALPAYMSPDRFVWAEPMPRTSTGKVDYTKLTGGAA